MGTYGNETFDTIGTGITVSADGAPIAKAAGVTVFWDAIAAHAGDVTYESEDYVRTGEKHLRYGTILCKIEGGVNDGKYVPYGTATGGGALADATGLSVLRGECFIMNESVHENDKLSDHPPVIDGGRVYQKRLMVVFPTVVAPTGYTLMPRATFEAAFPSIRYVVES